MAGLVAARLLRDSGFNVTLFEARQRLGGRLLTDHSLGVPSDLGASWIHGADVNPLTRWCKSLGIETVLAPVGARRFYDHGDFQRIATLQRRAWRGLASTLLSAGRSSIAARRANRTASLGSVIEPLLADQSLPYFDRRLIAWMASATEGVEGAPADRIDLNHWYPSESNGINALPVGGYTQLILDASRGLNVQTQTSVTGITLQPDGVSVATAMSSSRADAVIVAVPLSILKARAIQFDPPLPAPKVAAIDRIGYGGDAVMNKLVLRFEKQFWPDSNERLIVLPAEPSQRGLYTNWINVEPVVGAPVIMGFCTGPHAAEIDRNASDDEIVRMGMDNLARLTGCTPPAPSGYLITRWLSDPWARGSYSYSSIHSSDADRRDYQRSIANRIYFAGEGTQALDYGTVNAALRSGEQAALSIFSRYTGLEPTLQRLPWA
jgi:monoamine oxidase